MELSVVLLLLWIAFAAAADSSVSAETCGNKSCCWLDIPLNYCGITLPTVAMKNANEESSPMKIATRFIVKNLQEVDESKLSYIIDIK